MSTKVFRASLVSFVVVAALLLPFYRYQLGPDAISYISISKEYAAGYWREAVNAYWGPLYSWCIVPFLLAHVPGMLAGRLVELGAGVLALFALRPIALHLRLSQLSSRVFPWVAAAMILAFAMKINSPDLLFTAVLLLYIGIIADPAYPSTRQSGAVCGVLGALAYLTKSYGFFFFLAHFVAFTALHWYRNTSSAQRVRIAAHFFAGLAVFFAVSSAWILTLHAKYGTWMLSTTGEFNYRLVGPKSGGYPHFRHLMSPTSEHAITAWQDPSPSWLPEWHALGSRSEMKHEAKLIYTNAKAVFRFWTYTTPLFTAFLFLYIVFCLNSSTRTIGCIYLLLTIGLFSCGYLLVTVQDRYFWLTDLLLLCIAFRTLDLLSKASSLTPSAKAVLVAGVVLSFLVNPVLTLRGHFLEDRGLYHWAESIEQSPPIRGRLASCADWQDSAYLAYVLDIPYYGVPSPTPEADEVARDLNPDYRPIAPRSVDPNTIANALNAAGIDYFIAWPGCPPVSFATTPLITRAGDVQLVQLKPQGGNLER